MEKVHTGDMELAMKLTHEILETVRALQGASAEPYRDNPRDECFHVFNECLIYIQDTRNRVKDPGQN